MKIEILQERDNKPLGRREIDFKIDHVGEPTPSRPDIKAKLAAQFDADPATVIVRNMHTNFGIGRTTGSARIYTTPETAQRVENEYIIKRHEPKKKEGN
ncbi:MAG: 30S ribosomal protein S24e [Candidatus Thorarchaeota archaeon]